MAPRYPEHLLNNPTNLQPSPTSIPHPAQNAVNTPAAISQLRSTRARSSVG